jgi:Fur family transcriptional regulator, zinc uptake regulator
MLAHDHSTCIHSALDQAERLCIERGARFTPLRRKVLELIWAGHESIKAYDLLDALKDYDPSAKPATVYRSLDFLLEQGLIHRVETLNAFIGCRQPHILHDLLVLICEKCHAIEERSAPGVSRAVAQELESAHFWPQAQTLEILGLCQNCR